MYVVGFRRQRGKGIGQYGLFKGVKEEGVVLSFRRDRGDLFYVLTD